MNTKYLRFPRTNKKNETLNRLNLPDLLGNNRQIYECYWSLYEKT